MRIKILQDGDKVIGVDTEHITTIGYGDNVVEVETENGVKITNF